jgi:hypothetical protein
MKERESCIGLYSDSLGEEREQCSLKGRLQPLRGEHSSIRAVSLIGFHSGRLLPCLQMLDQRVELNGSGKHGAGVIPRIHLPRLKFPRQCVHRIVILD